MVKQVLIAGIVFLAGFYIGTSQESPAAEVVGVESKQTPTSIEADFSPFWKAWSLLDEKYVPPELKKSQSVSSQDRVWGAVQGMVSSLGDPNTIFLPPRDSEIFEDEINGVFEGVGMELGIKDGGLTVVAPLKGTPAYRAGVKPGDMIFKIDGKETTNINVDQAVRLIRGKKGTSVTLTIFREGNTDTLEITIVRDTIDIPTIETEWKGDVFIVRLYNFSGVSPALFRQALREFVEKGTSNKLVLDLRGNPGGFLEASIDIASWFLPAGKVVVREDFGDKREEIVYRSKGYNIFGKNLKMAVLIDGGSASASEILAGALSEHGVATLIGSKSFGKGSVQELLKVTPDTSLKITIARWVTPEGKSISLEGLTPDILLETKEKDSAEDKDKDKDPVLEKAIETLNK
ncbi:MAG: Carboxy-terminal-processing protease [Parcubacteria group bacterium Gr01-1014_107]|nr:MAG: Carboxy-terminal-processing protease [Parcubacteria group bacterium Gr01-1014_107]